MKKIIILVILALLIALPAQAFALGISPGERFVPNESAKTFEFRGLIFNNEAKDMVVELEVGGDLKAFVSVDPKVLEFTNEDKQKQYTYQVLVPFTIDPEKTTGYIIAKEQFSQEGKGVSIGSTLAVKSRITLGDRPPSPIRETVLEKIDSDNILEADGTKTTGLVVGKESQAGIFKNKIVGAILLIAGLLIMGGLVLMGAHFQKESSKDNKKKRDTIKKQKQETAQETLLELEDYIKKCKAKGFSSEKIKSELIKKEWSEKVVTKLLKRN
jgi:hypothetical protein